LAAVVASQAPVVAWLKANGITTYKVSANTPSISALMTRDQINALAATNLTAGIHPAYTAKPLGDPNQGSSFVGCLPYGNATSSWYQTINADVARSLVPGQAQGMYFCVADGGTPRSETWLPIAYDYQPGIALSGHAQVTTGIISNTYGNNTSITNARAITTHENVNTMMDYSGEDMFEQCFDQGIGDGLYPAPVISVSLGWISQDPILNWDTDSATNPHLMPSDQKIDFLAKCDPYPLFVMAAGNYAQWTNPTEPYVVNKAYNAIIVGASDSRGTTPIMAPFSSYYNPGYNDYELPHLVAPGVEILSANMNMLSNTGDIMDGPFPLNPNPTDPNEPCPIELNGTSFSTPMVSGVAMLVNAVWQPNSFTEFHGFPGEVKAVIMATATKNVADEKKVTNLGYGLDYSHPFPERKSGVGQLDAAGAVTLADPSNWLSPGNTQGRPRGRWAGTMNLTPGGFADNKIWKMTADVNGYMRVVINWESTSSGCYWGGGVEETELVSYPFGDCDGADLPDGDLDLVVTDEVTGAPGNALCYSNAYNGTWEVCDFPVVKGSSYYAKVGVASSSVQHTVLSIAWNDYIPSSTGVPAVPPLGGIALAIGLALIGILAARRMNMKTVVAVGIVVIGLGIMLTACGSNKQELMIPPDTTDADGVTIPDPGDGGVDTNSGTSYVDVAQAGTNLIIDSGATIDTSPSSCPGFTLVGTPAEIASTPRSHPGLELVALNIDGFQPQSGTKPFVASQPTYDRLVADMTPIGGLNLGPPSGSMSGTTLALVVDDPTFASMQAGTYTAWDCLNSYYRKTAVFYHQGVNSSHLAFNLVEVTLKGIYDINQIFPLYQSLPGVIPSPSSAGLIGLISQLPQGGYSYICAGQVDSVNRYDIMRGFGDCEAGCITVEYHCYQSTSSGVVTPTSDTTSSADTGCRSEFNKLCKNFSTVTPSM
jgi:hypothetical protein